MNVNDEEIPRLLTRLPSALPSAESSVRVRKQSHAVLTARKGRRPANARGMGAHAVEATVFAAIFLYLAGAVGEAFKLYQLMP